MRTCHYGGANSGLEITHGLYSLSSGLSWAETCWFCSKDVCRTSTQVPLSPPIPSHKSPRGQTGAPMVNWESLRQCFNPKTLRDVPRLSWGKAEVGVYPRHSSSSSCQSGLRSDKPYHAEIWGETSRL